MPRYVAFIRAVMIGRGGVDREPLIEAFARAGASSARSHITTGNVTFQAPPEVLDGLAESVEADLLTMAGKPKQLFVRSHADLSAVVRDAPFAGWPGAPEANELCVVFLPEAVSLPFPLPHVSERGDATYLSRRDLELFMGTHLINGRPGNPGAWLERLLGIPVTIRNINTVHRVLRYWDGSGLAD